MTRKAGNQKVFTQGAVRYTRGHTVKEGKATKSSRLKLYIKKLSEYYHRNIRTFMVWFPQKNKAKLAHEEGRMETKYTVRRVIGCRWN